MANADNTAPLPREPGSYVLLLEVAARQTLPIGRRQALAIEPGYYAYVGSAVGPGGLAARVGRHARVEKPRRWHIDYLRAATRLVEVWYLVGQARVECPWAAALAAMPGARLPPFRFGASDCRCPSHLIGFDRWPKRSAFARRIGVNFTVAGELETDL